MITRHTSPIFAGLVASSLLGGCTGAFYGPPNEYGTAPAAWVANHTLVRHNPYNPVISTHDEARGGFVAVLRESCAQPMQDAVAEASPPVPHCDDETVYKCWASRHVSARACADAITTHAIDQCVSKAGGQNYFTAKANIVLGSVLSAANVGAAAASIAHPGDNNAVSVALAANLASGTNNARGFAPATVTVKAGDFTSAEQAYVMAAGFTDAELTRMRSLLQELQRADGEPDEAYAARLSEPTQIKVRRDPAVLRYSRLHDAVYAVCPVSDY